MSAFFSALPTPREMAAWDRCAIDEYGARNEMLMENASREALRVLSEEFGDLPGARALLLAGPGNNGGDAFALARHLYDQGVETLVLHAKPQARYTGAAGYHLRLARRIGVETRFVKKPSSASLGDFSAPEILVDGLLGTGFSGELRPDMRAWIEFANALGQSAFVLALDIPSGLDGLRGVPCPVAVRADATVAFEAAKLGLVLPTAHAFVGELRTRPIGLPRRVREERQARFRLIEPGIVTALPPLSSTAHKGAAGHILIVGGSEGLTGAPQLAALGALRAGAGLVTVACPAGLATEIKGAHPEIMTLPLGQGRRWRPEMAPTLASALDRFDALVLGPGLGRAEETDAVVQAVLLAKRPPSVLDADCLYWMSRGPELLESLNATDILTPHPGEMTRLLAGTGDAHGKFVVTDPYARLETAERFTTNRSSVLILKGAYSVIAQAGAPTSLAPFATPSLAVGGSGDVLAGLTGALLGRGLSPLLAACLGVYWHGCAGELLDRAYPNRGNLAREIAHLLPQALAYGQEELLHANRQRAHDPESCDCDA
jgi:NAD(P)H-hydrate epimerase